MGLKAKMQSSKKPQRKPEANKPKVTKAKCAAKVKPLEAPAVSIEGLVAPDPGESKSGCLWCSIYPFVPGYAKEHYGRDGDKIFAKEKEGHTVNSHNLHTPYDEVDVLFVSDAPGTQEDKQGEVIAGLGKKILTGGLDMVFGKDVKLAVTNLIRCRPPRNRKPNLTELKSCSYELVREIEARKPKLVVVLGNESMGFLAGQTGITTYAGKLMRCVRPEFPDLMILACLSPMYVTRFDHEMERFVDTLQTAADFVAGKIERKADEGEYYVIDDLDDLRGMLDMLAEEGKLTSFDTETGSNTPFQKVYPPLLCLSFSNEEGVGYTVPFDHADSPWCVGGKKEHEREEVKRLLREFFQSGTPAIAQNEKFDRQHIRKALGIDLPIPVRDTMITHMVLDERRGTHGLKTLAYMYTGMGGYERPLDDWIAKHKECDPDKGGSYANIPGRILFPYAAMDADVTLRVDNGLTQEPDYRKNKRFRLLAEKYLNEVATTLADMEYAGAQVDTDIVAELDEEYSSKMAELSSQIQKLPKVRKYVYDRSRGDKPLVGGVFNPGSPQQLSDVLFDYYGETPSELTDKGFEVLKTRNEKANKDRKGKRVSFTDTVRESIAKREWEYFSTNAEVLHEYESRGNDLCAPILAYRGVQTLHGTFVKPLRDLLDEWGRVHGTYWVHGTVTGRLSSSDPNLQNIPNKGGGKIKRAYVSRFGEEGIILQADYSQVELRIAACWYDDASMIEAYRKGIDLHALTAADMHHMKFEDFMALSGKERKPMRTRAKRINFGVLYGGGPPALQATLKKDGVFVTIEECAEFIDQFFKVRPGLAKGTKKTEAFAKKYGYLEAFTGRRRRVPEVGSRDEQLVARALRQAINFPIQCGASECTLMSMVLINREMKRRGLKSKMILTVHDSLVFDCLQSEAIEVALLAKEIMENLPTLSEQVLPGLDWSWLKVPLVADFELGVNWGQLVEFDPTLIGEDDESGDGLWKEEDGKRIPARMPVNTDELCDLIEWKAAS